MRRWLAALLLVAAAAFAVGGGDLIGGGAPTPQRDRDDAAAVITSVDDSLDCDDDRRSLGTGDFGAPAPRDSARATPLDALRAAVAARQTTPTPQSIAEARTDGYWKSEATPSSSVVWLDIAGRTKARFDLRMHGANWAVAGSLICAENEK